MRITRLKLSDFRNYPHFVLEPSPGLTVLVGPNAAGKTNVIEAIQLASSTRSFRRPKMDEVVRWGAAGARVQLRAEEGGRLLEAEMQVDAEGRRTYRVNGQTIRRFSEVACMLPSVVFTPDDLEMAKGPAERRRSAIDDLGEQLSPTYGSLRHDYGRVVRHRNALLKDRAPARELEPWDEQLVALGSRLLTHRVRLLDNVMRRASQRYASMADGETLGFEYSTGGAIQDPRSDGRGAVEEAIRAELVRRRAEEERRAATLVGPHRDDIVFSVDGRNARSYASQGQHRTIALAWKLAEVEVVREVKREDPVLLLDDVMSELDSDRRAALSHLVSSDIQTLITTTNTGYFTEEMLARATMVSIGRDRL